MLKYHTGLDPILTFESLNLTLQSDPAGPSPKTAMPQHAHLAQIICWPMKPALW